MNLARCIARRSRASAAAAADVAAAAAAVGVDDDSHGVGDDDDGTSRYCIHPCHVPESRFAGSNTLAATPRKKRNGTHTDGEHINHLLVEHDLGERYSHGIRGAMLFDIIAIKRDNNSNCSWSV